MGKSITPTYVIKIESGKTSQIMCWSKKATLKNLTDWIMSYAKSLELGGCNDHISKAIGYIPYPEAVEIINQHSGDVAVAWKAGMFQIW